MNNNMEKNATGALARDIIIRTQQRKMEITVTCHNPLRECLHCHMAIHLFTSSL